MQKGLKLLWSLRAKLPEPARRRIRILTDPISGPLGSIRAVHTADRVVALTFDDGPDPASTPGVLDALARCEARASFFVLIDRAEANAPLIRRMLREGHDVGLHGLDHTRLTLLGLNAIHRQIEVGRDRLAALSGERPRFFRPPYGSQSLGSYLIARRLGMEVVVWSADCDDWVQRPEEQIAEIAVAVAAPGAVLLLHDGMASDPGTPPPNVAIDRARMTSLVLEGLVKGGYRALSLTALLEGRPAHRTAWFRP
jgi:peptidoglycan/xylan/chitin deacetylase (PgdA/CDA1 family)